MELHDKDTWTVKMKINIHQDNRKMKMLKKKGTAKAS